MSRFRLVRATLIALAAIAAANLLATFAVRAYGSYRLDRAVAAFEKEYGPLDPKRFEKPPVPDRDNAATWIGPGTAALVLFEKDRGVAFDAVHKPVSRWTPEQKQRIEAIVATNAPAFEILERSRAARGSSWNLRYGREEDLKLPNLLAAMNAAKLLTLRGRLALARGDRDTALRSIETLCAMARSFESENTVIVLLIGVAIERLGIELVHDVTAEPGAASAELERMEAALPDGDLEGAYRTALLCETSHLVRVMRRWSEDGKVPEVGAGESPRLMPNAMLIGINEALVGRGIDAQRAAYRHVGGPVTQPMVYGKDGGSWWSPLVDVYGPNLANGAARMTATRSARELAEVAIALRREALGSGRYPGVLPTVQRVAANDPLSGGPRLYAVREDGSAELRSGTTDEILHSIFAAGAISYDALYRWTLPPLAARPGKN